MDGVPRVPETADLQTSHVDLLHHADAIQDAALRRDEEGLHQGLCRFRSAIIEHLHQESAVHASLPPATRTVISEGQRKLVRLVDDLLAGDAAETCRCISRAAELTTRWSSRHGWRTVACSPGPKDARRRAQVPRDGISRSDLCRQHHPCPRAVHRRPQPVLDDDGHEAHRRRPQAPRRRYHLDWQLDTMDVLAATRETLLHAGVLTGESSHEGTKSLYAPIPTATSSRSCGCSPATRGAPTKTPHRSTRSTSPTSWPGTAVSRGRCELRAHRPWSRAAPCRAARRACAVVAARAVR